MHGYENQICTSAECKQVMCMLQLETTTLENAARSKLANHLEG